jgi:hypothetical protein
MPERHGKNSQIIIDGAVLKCNTFDLNMDQDTVEVTGFGDPHKRYVLGHKNFAAPIGGFWNDTNDKLWDVTAAEAEVYTYFYPDVVNAPAQYWWGSCLVSASLASSTTSAVNFTGNIVAFGPITRAGLP